MTKVRGIDANNDFVFGKGLNDYKRDRDAVAQNIKTRLQSFLGDCFFDLTAGVDWFNLLGSKRILELRLDVAAVILNTEFVENIVEVSAEVDNERAITIQYEVETSFGNIEGSITQG